MSAPTRRINRGRGHTYLLDGQKADGVTWIISNGIPKPALTNWAARTVAETAVQQRDMWDSLSEGAAIEWLKQSPYSDRDKAANRGTQVHNLAEKLALGEEVDVPEPLTGHVDAYLQFRDDWQPTDELLELTVINRRHRYMGTLDLICEMAGERWLLDIKGLALDTPIPTPDGWTTMGAIRVGDTVFGADGRPCNVTATSEIHERPCVRLQFDDGTDVICDDEHRWAVRHSATGSRSVLTASDIARDLAARTGRGTQRRLVIDNAAPLDLPHVDLPIDPYLLGAWLGDGTAAAARISLGDHKLDVLSEFKAAGFEVRQISRYDWAINGGFRTQLRKAGLLGNKDLPDEYLRASADQRLALLQGLMDTDGCWNKARRRALFISTDKGLAAAVAELVVSLGWRTKVTPANHTGYGLTVEAYHVEFTPIGVNPFRHRNRDVVRLDGTTVARRRLIHSANPTLTVPTRCIAVDSPDNTYLCGEQMVPTHNTNRSGPFGEVALQLAAYRHAETYLDPATGDEVDMPPVDRCGVIWVRADGYDLYPFDTGDSVFRTFLYAQQIAHFTQDGSKTVRGEALYPTEVTA